VETSIYKNTVPAIQQGANISHLDSDSQPV